MNLIWMLQCHTLIVLSSLVLHVRPQQTVPLCPNIPLSELDDPSPFTCTTLVSQSWRGSAFTDQCPTAPDQITLNGNSLPTGTCGAFTGTVTDVTGSDVTSSLSFTPTEDMDGLGIQCEDGLGNSISNFTIEIIADNLIITVEDSPTTYGCVTATVQHPANTTGISNYRVEAILNGNVVTESMSDDADDLEVEICSLNLCDESYMFRAEANGGNICPSELMSGTITLSALGRVGNVRRSGADTIEWDRPSGAPVDCTVSYTISVAGGPAGTITRSADSTMIALSAINQDLDTCDSNLRITVIAEVPSIGAVATSISDEFDPTSAFPEPTDLRVVDPPTYAITDDSTVTVIQITMTAIADEVLGLFPDAYINISYSGSQPSCGGSSRVVDNVAQVDISCLGEMNVDFTAVLMDDPDCRSSSTNLPSQSFPRIAEPDFQRTIATTSNRATVSFPESDDVSVQEDSFDVVGTATPVNGGTAVESDRPATYPDSAVFSNLESNTSYNFAIQIVSQATDGTMIGSFSGSFTTMPSSASSSIGAIVGGVVGGIAALLVAAVIVVLVYLFCCRDRNKGEQHPGPVYEDISSHNSPRDIDVKDNVAYGPVTPHQPAAMYEQPERIEMSGNVAYGQISH